MFGAGRNTRCPVIGLSAGFLSDHMANPKSEKAAISGSGFDEDELFLDQLKDSFCFFFAATVTLMEMVKYLNSSREATGKDSAQPKA